MNRVTDRMRSGFVRRVEGRGAGAAAMVSHSCLPGLTPRRVPLIGRAFARLPIVEVR